MIDPSKEYIMCAATWFTEQPMLGNYKEIVVKLAAETKNVSAGGCGYFALILWDKLLALGVPKKDICVRALYRYRIGHKVGKGYYSNLYEINDYLNYVIRHQKDCDEYGGWSHLMIQVRYNGKLYLMDNEICLELNKLRVGNGILFTEEPKNYFRYISTKVYYEQLSGLMKVKKIAWNGAFNKKQVPCIKEIVSQFTL